MAGPAPTDWTVDAASAGAREIAPDVWRLRLPLPWEGNGHANAYAVGRGDEVVLFDCGTAGHPTNEAALDVALAAAGLRVEDVALLVGTHAHSDHIGLAAHVVERAGCELWGDPTTGPLYDGRRDPDGLAARRIAFARREGAPDEVLPACGDMGEELHGVGGVVEPHRALGDGDVVSTPVGDWRAVATPGHSPSHLCFVQEERSMLIVGDIVCAVFVPWFDIGGSPDPYAEWQASLDRIDGLGPFDLVLPGHGRPMSDLAGAVALHRDGLAGRLEQVADAVAAEPAGAWDLTLRVLGVPDRLEDAVWGLDEVLGYLRHLHLTGRVVREVQDDRAIHRPAA